MSCLISRTPNGAINRVTTPKGEDSKLFNEIHSNVFLADAETSVKILTNAYTESVQKTYDSAAKNTYDTGEPKLFYMSSKGVSYDNLEELLIHEENGNISMGFKHPTTDKYTPIAGFTNKGNQRGEFIASKVREGKLSAERTLGKDGVTRFQGKGEFVATRVATASMVSEDLASEVGNGRVQVNKDGTLEIEFSKGYSRVVNEDGQIEYIQTQNILEYLENNNPQNKEDLLLLYTVEYDNPRSVDKDKSSTKKNKLSQKELETSLFSFLKSVGFSIESLENYKVRYRTKFGNDPDIQALTDMSNKIVAFKEGRIGIEDLSEEVAHIAIEAYSDQKSIASALVNVHLTPEYAEYSDYYREKYAPHYEGVALEEQVRKEILGKVLKREFLNRFQSSEQTHLMTELKKIWQGFVNFIKNRIKPYHVKHLEKLNKNIADSVLNNTSEDFLTDISDNENFFYSAMNSEGRALSDEFKKAKRAIEDLYKVALNQSLPNKAQLDKLAEESSKVDTLASVSTIVNIAQRNADVLAANVREAKNKGELLSSKDAKRYEVLKSNLIPAVNNIKSQIKKEDFPKELHQKIDNLENAADEVVLQMSRVEPYINIDKKNFVEKMLEKILSRTSLTEEEKDNIRKSLEGGKDTTWIGYMFGLASQSKNIVINLLQTKAVEVNVNTRQRFKEKSNEVITEIVNNGLEKYQKDIINYDENGNPTNYLLSARDYAKDDKLVREKENELIAKYSGRTDIEKIDSERDTYNPSEIVGNEENYSKYLKELKEWKDSTSERRMKADYYTKGEDRFKEVNASDETIDYLRTKNIGRFERNRKYRVEGGRLDLSNQTESDKIEDQTDKANYLATKSPVDSSGTIKQGLRRVDSAKLTQEQIDKLPYKLRDDYRGPITLIEEGKKLEDLSIESRIAFDLFNLDMLYLQEVGEGRETEVSKEFKDKVKDGASYEWVMSNADINLTSDFYDSLGEFKSFVDIAQGHINEMEDDSKKRHKQANLDNLVESLRSRKDLLKQNKKLGSNIDTDVHSMTTQVRGTLIALDEEITELKRALNIPSDLFEDSQGNDTSESGLNEDFQRMYTESSSNTIFDFALEHMTKGNFVLAQDFARELSDYMNGRRSHITSHFDKFVSEMVESGVITGKTKAEALQILKDEYAMRRVASYFRRFQPQGYTELIGAMKSGELSMDDVLNKSPEALSKFPTLKYVEVTPEHSWMDNLNSESGINPNYKQDGPSRQPKVLNEEFFSRFGISKEEYLNAESEDLRLLTPTKNKEQYRLLTLMTELRELSSKNYGDEGNINKFFRVQKSKETMEKVLNIHKNTRENLSDFVKDLTHSMKDEKEYGEEIEGTSVNIKIIPKYYQSPLNNPKILTENIIEAAMLDLQSSIKYSERKAVERDVKALEHQLAEQKYTNGGGKGIRARITKRGEVSNYYKKGQEYIDSMLYGIRQSRRMTMTMFGKEVDITQLFGNITGYVAKKNLAYNVISDATSYTTGVFNNIIDTVAGDYYSVDSAKKASRDLIPMVAKYMLESGKLKKSSDLHHLMEWTGVEDIESKYKESASGRILRSASKSYFAASKIANLPVTPKNMLAVLYDFKFHNGRFKDFNSFARDLKIADKTIGETEIRSLWKKQGKPFKEYLNIDADKGVQISEEFKELLGDKWQEELNDVHKEITNKITHINQNVDSIVSEEDRTAAQRDALTASLLLHRSWFIINLTRKFKGRHFNIATGQIEEGHYKSVVKTLRKKFKGIYNKEAREAYKQEVEEFERRNMKRLVADVTGVLLTTGLAILLLKGDDDDDTVFENFAQLIALRTASEVQSLEVLGIYGSVKDIYDQPLVQTSIFTNLKKSYKAYNREGGDWISPLGKDFLVSSRYMQLSDIQKQVESYIHFNKSTLKGIEQKKEDRK